MKTFPRLLRDLPPKFKKKDFFDILNSYEMFVKDKSYYFSRLSRDQQTKLLLSIFFLNNNLSLSAEDLLTSEKLYLVTVLSNSDEQGTETCEDCSGSEKIECSSCNGRGSYSCEYCNDGSNPCENCDGGDDEDCGECEGTGEIPCGECDQDGEVDCEDCSGVGEQDCDNCYNVEKLRSTGFVDVEDATKYTCRVYVVTRLSQVQEIKNAVVEDSGISFEPLFTTEVDIDTIEDFERPSMLWSIDKTNIDILGFYFITRGKVGLRDSVINGMKRHIFSDTTNLYE